MGDVDVRLMKEGYKFKQLCVFPNVGHGPRASFAMQLTNAFCMGAAVCPNNGERLSEKMIVTAAVEITDLLFKELNERGWNMSLPTFEDYSEGQTEAVGFFANQVKE